MLEGHEICEVKYSYLYSILDYRIESEYFLKKFQRVDKVLSHNKCERFSEIFDYLNGRPYSSTEFSSLPIDIDSIYVAKIGDVTKNRPTDMWENISNKEFKNQKGQFLVEGDILMTLTGDPPDVGKVSYIHGDIGKATWNQRVSRITLKNPDYSSCYAYILLKSEYCRTQIERYAKGIRQRNLGNDGLESVIVPMLPKDIQQKVEKLVESAHSLLEKSKLLYKQAAEQMLSDLGLNGFTPHNTLHTTKRFSEFSQSGRLDAEYYQTKYDELLDALKRGKYKTIKELQIINYRGLQPEYVENGTIDVINSKHILEDGLDYENFEKTDEVSFNGATRSHVQKGDVLTYTTGANIGRTQVYFLDKKAMASNHVNILRVKDVNPVFLALFMNSVIGRMQTERACSGSAQVELYPDDIANFIVPLLPSEIQTGIADLVLNSFECKKRSRQLLQDAVQLVEKEIENMENR